MNPHRDPDLNLGPPPNPDQDYHPPPASWSPPVDQTGHSFITVLHHAPPWQTSPNHQDPGSRPESRLESSPAPTHSSVPPSTQNRYLSQLAPIPSPDLQPVFFPIPSPDLQPVFVPIPSPDLQPVSIPIPSPDLQPAPLQSQCSEESCPDLECSICFSQFNNVFRCPKMLHCQHTFCLECLARINVKSAEPGAIQCPLCRGLTPLPALGLPKLTTDLDVLSYLPAAMQRVYSIRFVRNKGKLQVKRATEGPLRWGRRSLTSLRSINRSLDVGLPSPTMESGRRSSGVGGALFWLTGRPACRAFILTAVVMMLVLLTGIIVFLLTYDKDSL